MAIDPRISEFIERARAAGASEESLVGILKARGWPEKDVYEALAAHYERSTGIEVPRRSGTGIAAKDAFFYLLVFSTLATWTISLGSLSFDLIDQWLADTLFSSGYNQGYDAHAIPGAIASILVAFPIYLLVSRTVVREGREHPEKLNSPVRRWLTYMALVIAACVFIGDLITALSYFLRGEITSRFLAKAFVVLVLSGGVFFYYFVGLRKSEDADVSGRLSRDTWMASVSAVAVIAMVIAGFWHSGGPSTQRTQRADEKRVADLYQLSSRINSRWVVNGHNLPGHLDELPGATLADPVTRVAYEYHPKQESHYELCATFSLATPQGAAVSRPSIWTHPAGHHCIALDAAETPENPTIYFPD